VCSGHCVGLVDLGSRVVIVMDGLCSPSDEAYDRMLTHYHGRYGRQVVTVTTDTLLQIWA
jgi:hypothetical protein